MTADVAPGGGTRPLLCECEYTRKPATWQVVDTLWKRMDDMRIAGLYPTIAVFSGSGFADSLEDDAEDHGIMLIGLEEILRGKPAPPIPLDCSRR